MKEDLYNILDINKSASASEIKKAYRTKAKEHHPDKGGDDETFKNISYAYEVLSNEDKKSIYDSRGHSGLEGGQRNHTDNFHDFMRAQQAQHQENQMRHNSLIKANISITVEDVYNGTQKSFEYNRRVKCEPCGGEGGTNPSRCSTCDGTGVITNIKQTQFGYMEQYLTCHHCNGGGTSFDDTCSTCNGNGISTTREHHHQIIDHSLLKGEQIVVPGKGHIMPNGLFSDLIMTITVAPHPRFQIGTNFDLYSIVKVPYETMVLGGKIEFETIDGGKVKFTVPKFSKVNSKLNLKEKGLRKPNFNHVRGNQIIVLDVDMPSELLDEEAELLEKVKKLKE